MVYVLVAVGGHVDGAAAVRWPTAVGTVLLPDEDRVFCVVRRTDRGQRCRVRVRRRRAPFFQPQALTSRTNRTSRIFDIFLKTF